MNNGNKLTTILIGVGVALLQIIMTQVVTFLFSLVFPAMDNFPGTNPVLFILLLGITYSIGVYLTGWLALKWHWLKLPTKYLARLLGTLIGAYLPLVIALIITPTLEPGNPGFFIAIFTCVLGFFLAGWFGKR